MRPFRTTARVLLLTATLAGTVLVGGLGGGTAHADARPLALRYALTGYLGVEQAGNTLLSCPDNSSAGGEPCAAARAGGMVGNDGYPMSYVDTDGITGTFNSSTAQVLTPPGAVVAFAGLYWGGDAGTGNAAGTPGCQSAPSANRVTLPPAPGRAGQVLVSVGSSGYRGVAASTLDTLPSSLGGATFQGFADITRLFAGYANAASAAAVPVTVANAQLAQGLGCSGGWTVLLVYQYPNGPAATWAPTWRDVRVFDGLVGVAPGSAALTATADGFRAATDGGPVGAELGLIAYDGDRGVGGEQVTVNGAAAGADVADSTVAGSGYGQMLSQVGPITPSYRNTLGYDSHVLDLPEGVLTAGSTSAAAALASTSDAVTVGALVLVARADPVLGFGQTVTRADGSDAGYADVTSGTKLRYTLRLAVAAPVTGVTVTAPPAPGLDPVAGSLTVNGAAADPATSVIAATGVTVALPGLDPGGVTVIAYDAIVRADAPAGVPLVSRASVRYTVGGVALLAYSQPAVVLANRVDLALTQKASTDRVAAGHPAGLTITVTNQGKVPASGVTVADPVPGTLTLVSAAPVQGSYDPASGAWTVGSLAPGASAVLVLTVAPGVPPQAAPTASPAPSASGTPVPTPAGTASEPALVTWPVTNTAEISGGDQPDVDSLAGDALAGEDDIASVTLTVSAAPSAAPSQSPDGGLLAGTARPAELRVGNILTILGALLGAALILVGGMVLVSSRRR